MAELEQLEIYAYALAMPNPEHPVKADWVAEITQAIAKNPGDEIYLVGHSLGVPAILRYLESESAQVINGAVLVSGLIEKIQKPEIESFLETPFDFAAIKSHCRQFAVIHGDDDPNVPPAQASLIAESLSCPLIWVKNGGHLNGSSGWLQLPECLTALQNILD